jgi:hypothetical protein
MLPRLITVLFFLVLWSLFWGWFSLSLWLCLTFRLRSLLRAFQSLLKRTAFEV